MFNYKFIQLYQKELMHVSHFVSVSGQFSYHLLRARSIIL
jgi:hypothetical protein